MLSDFCLKDEKWVWPLYDEATYDRQKNDKKLFDVLNKYITNKRIMIQAGGNCGLLLSTFTDHFNFIYTFEPDPVNFYCLTQNVSSNHVSKIQACLGKSNGTTKVQQLVRPDKPHDTGGVHICGDGYLPLLSIDSLNLPECDLIQLDVEGYELNALLGAIETIKKYKPVLCIEFCEKWLNRYDSTSDDILEVISGLGYKLVDEYGVDKIFVHNEL